MFRRAVVLLLSLLAADAAAQTVTLTVTDAGSLMQDATLDDYAQGFIIGSTPVTYTVTLNGGSTSVCATVYVRGATQAGGDKAVGEIKWGANATNQNVTLTTSAHAVGSLFLTTSNRTRSGVLYFRTPIDWTDAPNTYIGPSLTFSVTGRRLNNANQCT